MDIVSAIAQGAQILGKTCANNLPAIQTGVSMLLTATCPLVTAKNVSDAIKIIDEEKKKRGPNAELSKGEILELTWKKGITPAAMVLISLVLQGKTYKDLKSMAVAATALAAMENKSKLEYQEETANLLGKGKDRKIKDEIAKNKIEELSAYYNGQLPFILKSGNWPCVDAFSGCLFQASVEGIRKAANDINEVLNDGGKGLSVTEEMCLNDFYASINDPVWLRQNNKSGVNLGWMTGKGLELEPIKTVMWNDSIPALYVDYPLYDLASGVRVH